MDGSLLTPEHTLPPGFAEVREALRKHDIFFAAASGRQYASILDKFGPLAEGAAILAENGAYATLGEEILNRQLLARQKASEVLEVVGGLNEVIAALCTPNCAYTLSGQTEFIAYMSEFYVSHAVVDEFADVGDEVVKIALYHPTSSEEFIYPYVKHFAPQLNIKISGKHWVDISHPAAHKGTAVSKLQERLGIAPAQTMAFGDFHNDLEMLALADFSYAMANAHPAVKKAARFETTSNADGGVVEVLKAVLQAASIARPLN